MEEKTKKFSNAVIISGWRTIWEEHYPATLAGLEPQLDVIVPHWEDQLPLLPYKVSPDVWLVVSTFRTWVECLLLIGIDINALPGAAAVVPSLLDTARFGHERAFYLEQVAGFGEFIERSPESLQDPIAARDVLRKHYYPTIVAGKGENGDA